MNFRGLLKKFRAIIKTKHVGGFNDTLFVQSTTVTRFGTFNTVQGKLKKMRVIGS